MGQWTIYPCEELWESRSLKMTSHLAPVPLVKIAECVIIYSFVCCVHIKEKRKMAYPVLVRTHKTSLVCQPAGPQRPTLPPAHAHHWDAVWPEETTCAHLNTAGDNIADKRIKRSLCHEKQLRA